MINDETLEPDIQGAMSPPTLQIRSDGKITYDSILVGRFEEGLLTVDLGWCKAAGVNVTIKADPEVDRVRGGIVLAR